jgi:RNA polymerase sigma-70 factor (ECF subfamily)
MTARLRLVAPFKAAEWTDAQIKELAQNDLRAAMDMVIRKHRERLYYHALGIVKNSAEAYDLVQEVFIRAMREHRFFDEEFRQKAWLYRVTSNLCFNRVRDRKRRGAILDAMHKVDRAYPDQVDRVFGDERKQQVLAAIDKMTENHKEILLLRYYDDLSYAEIAEVLDIKLGTVMSRLSRARGRLLEVMSDQTELLD